MGMLDSKVAFITGGASGIGAAIARRFATEGACVALADVRWKRENRCGMRLSRTGGRRFLLRAM
jgi:NAD(P)-dependent dehydrogenase (short-subunit alcohol dehydrogenase family)